MKNVIGAVALFGLLIAAAVYFKPNTGRGTSYNDPANLPAYISPLTGDSIPAVDYHFDGKALSMEAFGQNAYILQGSNSREFYLYVTTKGAEITTDKKRVPLNISLVLDRSGSMSGDKIKYVKKAADFVVDQLGSDDILSIVNYDDDVEVSSTSQNLRNKEILHAAIAKIYDRGSTNLTGGMLEGYTQVKSTKKDGYVNRVLLLSDGLANVGITEPGQIQNIAQKKFREEGIALSTFGVGADFNEDLMTNLAEYGGANYYFIGTPDQIPGIFAKELSGLLQVVAQNTKLNISFPTGLTCEKVYGYPSTITAGKVSINFNDVFSKEEKAVLIKFTSAAPITSNLQFNCAISYVNAQTFNTESSEKTITASITTDAEKVKAGKNKVVDESVVLFRSTELFEEAMAEADKGNYQEAESKTMYMNVYLDSAAANGVVSTKLSKQREYSAKYYNDVKDYDKKSAVEVKMLQKESKSANYNTKKMREVEVK